MESAQQRQSLFNFGLGEEAKINAERKITQQAHGMNTAGAASAHASRVMHVEKGKAHRVERAEDKNDAGAASINQAVGASGTPQWIAALIAKHKEGRLQCPSPANKDHVAFADALELLHKHGFSRVAEFVAQPSEWVTIPLEERGLSSQFLRDFQVFFSMGSSCIFLVALWMVQIITQGTGKSLAEMMADKTDAQGRRYRGKPNRFMSHATSHSAQCDYDALIAYEEGRRRAGVLDDFYYCVDVFSINQNNVTDRDELGALENAINAAGTTLLVFDSWHAPTVMTRIWCVFEIYKTLKNKKKLEVCFCAKEQESLIEALQDTSPHGFGLDKVLVAVSALDAAYAQATHASDKDKILTEVCETVEGGINGLNAMVKNCLRAALSASVQGVAEDLTRRNVRSSVGNAAETAEISAAVGKFLANAGQYEKAIALLEPLCEKWRLTDLPDLIWARIYSALGDAYSKGETSKDSTSSNSYAVHCKALEMREAAVMAWERAEENGDAEGKEGRAEALVDASRSAAKSATFQDQCPNPRLLLDQANKAVSTAIDIFIEVDRQLQTEKASARFNPNCSGRTSKGGLLQPIDAKRRSSLHILSRMDSSGTDHHLDWGHSWHPALPEAYRQRGYIHKVRYQLDPETNAADSDESLKWSQKAIALFETMNVKQLPEQYAFTLQAIGNVFNLRGEPENMIPWRQRALVASEQILGHDHKYSVKYRKQYADVLAKVGREEEAQSVREGAEVTLVLSR
jgi:tetratricopeptide (TPR) repeat protein